MHKRKIFISYHFGPDQKFYDKFCKLFSDEYEVFCDVSPEQAIHSHDIDYVRWTLRKEYIKGSSCMIVLCGVETGKRKFVDWEIKAALDMGHGLVGVLLPLTLWQRVSKGHNVPQRLKDNVDSKYAELINWKHCTPEALSKAIEKAVKKPLERMKNTRPPQEHNVLS